jgi:hypothetical protein
VKRTINKKFESKDQLIDWFGSELKKKGVCAGSIIFQKNSTGSNKVDEYILRGYLIKM